MADNTPNLDLYKVNPVTDGDDTFNIDTVLNENWDKIDAAAGSQTITDAQTPTGDTGTPKTLLGWLANMIKSITGKSSWRTAPATTLEAAKTHADDNIRHLTAAERTAWNGAQKYKITGDTGQGLTGQVAVNANTLIETGIYTLTTASLNIPLPANTTSIFVRRFNTTHVIQEADVYATVSSVNTIRKYSRHSRDGGATWSAWLEFAPLDASGDLALTAIPDSVQKISLTQDNGKALALATGTDLNTVQTIGFYTGTGLVNAPGSGWYHIIVQTHSGVSDGFFYFIQTATSLNGASAIEYARRCVNGVWEDWTIKPANRRVHKDTQLTSTVATTVASYTAPAVGMYVVKIYLRVAVARTVSIVINYTSPSGNKSHIVLPATSMGVEDYTFIPVPLYLASGSALNVVAQTTVANSVYISTTITEEG